MNLVRFKKFILLKEDEASQESFNSFVEDVITTNKIDIQKANSFFDEIYDYKKPLFRVIFIPRSEFDKYQTEDDVNHKDLSNYISSLIDQKRLVFFSKSITNLENLIKFPGLFKIDESHVGVVIMSTPQSTIDLTKYNGKNPKVVERLKKTQEVLSFEDLKITKIEAVYKFKDGWKMEIL